MDVSYKEAYAMNQKQGKSKLRSGKRENAQVMEGKGLPDTSGRRKAWFSPLTRSATSCGGNPSILLIGPGRKSGRLRLSRWT